MVATTPFSLIVPGWPERIGSPNALTKGVVRRLGIASNRNATAASLTTGLNWSTRVRKFTGAWSTRAIVLRCPWFYVTSSSVETVVGNTATIYASIEYPAGSGVFYQALKSGVESVTAVDGGHVDFDPIDLTIPSNSSFDVHTYVLNSVSSNKMPPNCTLLQKTSDGYESSNVVLTNKTMAGGETAVPSSGYLAAGYSPIVLGQVEVLNARDCPLFGDSIPAGAQENSNLTTAGDDYGNIGPFERLLGLNGFAYLNLARAGTKASQWQVANAMNMRLALLTGIEATVAINELGANDFTAVASSWAGYMATINGRIAPYARKVVGATITPYQASSSDGWTTTAGQTAVSPTNNIAAFNSRVRAGTITGQAGYLAYNEALADSTDEMVWRNPASVVNPTAGPLTGDGLHPNLLGAQTAASAMDPAPLLS